MLDMTKKKRIDLHIHSSLSDGNYSPDKIASIAYEQGLSALSITDHDTLFPEAQAVALSEKYSIEVIPGVEFSAVCEQCNIHVLGYYLDESNRELQSFLAEFRRIRAERAEKMINILRMLGIRISIEKARQKATGGILGRPHLADLLMEAGYVADYGEAYRKYLGQEAPAYVMTNDTPVDEIIDIIHKADGIAFMAHPGLGCAGKHIEKVIECGVDGLEVYHPKHNPEQVAAFEDICHDKSLLMSGGSDHHGKRRWLTTIGTPEVPYSLLEILKIAAGARRHV